VQNAEDRACYKSEERILVNAEQVEEVEEFVYREVSVDKEGGGSRDIRNNAGTGCRRHVVHSRDYERCGKPEE